MEKETYHEVKKFCTDIVLALGGIFAVHEVDDDVVWQTAKTLDRLMTDIFLQLRKEEKSRNETVPRRKYTPHPAIEELLRSIENDGEAA